MSIEPEAVSQEVPPGAVVVGHDGSGHATRALEEALEIARALETRLSVVRSFTIATAPRAKDWTFGYVPSVDEFAAAVREELLADTHAVVSRFPEVAVRYHVVNGAAAAVLVAASDRARMVVVGSRGLGGLRGMVLGSVSDKVVRYAACPVLVTRD